MIQGRMIFVIVPDFHDVPIRLLLVASPRDPITTNLGCHVDFDLDGHGLRNN